MYTCCFCNLDTSSFNQKLWQALFTSDKVTLISDYVHYHVFFRRCLSIQPHHKHRKSTHFFQFSCIFSVFNKRFSEKSYKIAIIPYKISTFSYEISTFPYEIAIFPYYFAIFPYEFGRNRNYSQPFGRFVRKKGKQQIFII